MKHLADCNLPAFACRALRNLAHKACFSHDFFSCRKIQLSLLREEDTRLTSILFSSMMLCVN